MFAIELTLSRNNVDGVYNLSSVGQLIPFAIGLLGLVRSAHLVIMESLERVRFPTPDYLLKPRLRSYNVT